MKKINWLWLKKVVLFVFIVILVIVRLGDSVMTIMMKYHAVEFGCYF